MSDSQIPGRSITEDIDQAENPNISEATPLITEDEEIHSVSSFEVIYHIVCVIAGTGLLQIPFSFKTGGWLSISLLVFSAIVNIYTGRLIIYCLQQSSDGYLLDGYPAIGQEAFGAVGKYTVMVFYNMAMCGSVCLYLILASLNLQNLIGIFSDRIWILILSSSILIPFIFLKSLKEVGWISLFGAIASAVVVLIVAICSVQDYSNYKDLVDHKLIDFSRLGSVLGTFCFSYGGNYVYPEIYRNMGKNKSQFNGAMTIAVGLITILYTITGIFGYSTYGSQSVSPVLFNLSEGWPRTLSLIIITFHVTFACPLLLTTISSDIERGFGIETFFMRTVARSLLIAALCAVSILLPYFADMMNLIGALSNTMLIFILPIVCRYMIDQKNGKSINKWTLAGEGFILVFGLIGGFFGTFDALQALYCDLKKG